MRKKHVIILVFAISAILVSALVFFKKQEASMALNCEISEFLKLEIKLVQHSYRQASSDEFFWTYFGQQSMREVERSIHNAHSRYSDLKCEGAEEAFAWSILASDEQIEFLKVQKAQWQLRKNLTLQMDEKRKTSNALVVLIQKDLKKYRFHVRQLKNGFLPAQIMESACRAPASAVDLKRQRSCRRALTLTKEFRIKDESNLGTNRRILLEKWRLFKDWIESAISKIEQTDGKDEDEAPE